MLQNQVGWQAVGEELVLQKSYAITRIPKQRSRDRERALLQIFHPKPVHHPLGWRHGTLREDTALSVLFFCQIGR
jgi:hypothetical protein